MTRIIAGRAKGHRLKVPATGTRPTSDRVRESIFSSLESVVDLAGLRVLDLYAGSGALGLEAASRGAGSVVLVDHAAAVVRVIRTNIGALGLPGVAAVKLPTRTYLNGVTAPFDLVFLDPPYEVAAEEVSSLLTLLTRGWLGPQAVVVVERGAFGAPFDWPPGFEDLWLRRFGDTHVHRAIWYGRSQHNP